MTIILQDKKGLNCPIYICIYTHIHIYAYVFGQKRSYWSAFGGPVPTSAYLNYELQLNSRA